MLLSLHSLSSPKKGAAFSFVLLAAVALLVVGILSVTAVHSKTVIFSPIFVGASINQSYNFTITLGAGSATINEIRITKPGDFTAIYCLNANPVGGWSCATNGTTSAVSYVEFTGGSLAAGSLVSINITSTSAAGAANYSFTVRTQGDGEAANTTYVNVTVDAHPPKVDLVNVSDGTQVLSRNEMNGLYFLKNATKGIVFVINATDNSSGMAQGAVNLYYNLSNLSVNSPLIIDYRNDSSANVSVFAASSGSYGETSLYNVTLNISAMSTLNGTRVAFIIVANDSVHNGNVSNASVVTSSYVYNFTIDAVAPQFVDVQIANQSLNATTAMAINITSVLTSKVEYILNSSLVLNVSALVRDDGGAGTVKVEVMNRSGTFMTMDLLTGTNGSTGSTTWNFSAFNITDLVKGFAGDGLYNISFRATDNVSNVNNTYNFTVQVDDTPPTVSVASNITIGASSILSAGNVTLSNTSVNNTAFVLRLITSDNLNNNTANISVAGNLGNRYNLTYESGTPSGISSWNITVKNGSLVNITNFCTFGSDPSTFGPDKSTCNFQFNVSDVMGRVNNSVNLTIAVDGLTPNVSILSPVLLTTNYTGIALINVSVNDSVGPLQNVSFRIRNNATAVGSVEGFYSDTQINVTNVTNWIPMSLGSGGNSQFSAQGYWNFTINLTALNFSDGSYAIEINATDSAGRQNSTVNVTNVIFDSSTPQNISIVAPATNSFWNANFTIGLNATERISGLLNVSVRLENGTHNTPWVGVQQAFPGALTSVTGAAETVRFNATSFNLTHIGSGINNISLNATNGNFTLRLNVTDTAGNQNTSVTINFTIDTVPPSSVTIIAPANGLNQSSNFTINVSAVESNIASVQYRWENGSEVASNQGQNFSNWISMNNVGGANNWNATFNLTEGAPLDGNYTIKVNVTDKVGWNVTTTYIQLVLDRTVPVVQLVGLAGNSIASNSIYNATTPATFVVNVTVNDTGTWGMSLGSIVTTNINGSSVRLINRTRTGTGAELALITSMSIPTTSAGGNYTNASFGFSSVPNGVYDINITVNDTAGNINYTIIANITLDNTAPRVTAITTYPAATGGVGVTGTINITANVTDNLGFNPSGIDNNSVNLTFFNSAGVIVNSTRMTINRSTNQWNTTIDTTSIADGDYTVYVNATDASGNKNYTQSMGLTIQNGASNVQARNFTFLGGFVTGSDTNQTSPTLLLNTTANSTCLYAIDNPSKSYYSDFLPQASSNTMGNNVSKQQITNLGFLPDRSASGYAIYYSCKDVSGNFTQPSGYRELSLFSVDTRNFFNITMGSSGDNKVRGDYFATGWNSLELPKTALLANTGLPTNYNITNVLSSLGNSRLTTANFTTIFAYNGTAWASYVVGAVTNTFTNFTADTPNSKYYINITVTNERLEIN